MIALFFMELLNKILAAGKNDDLEVRKCFSRIV